MPFVFFVLIGDAHRRINPHSLHYQTMQAWGDGVAPSVEGYVSFIGMLLCKTTLSFGVELSDPETILSDLGLVCVSLGYQAVTV